jgi:4-amino-4-deoxy-L-arabinose transferase-like glycosyltransferase
MGKSVKQNWWLGLAGVFIFVVYLLLLPGYFHSVDESAMYVAAHNAWREGNPHTNQMAYSLWAIRPGEAVTMLSPTGDIYTKKSPLMVALMVPFVWLGLRLPWWSTVQAVLLLGPLIATLTAVLLGRLIWSMSSRRVAVLAMLLFAFTTMALPYAQTVFSEPLAALGLLLAVAGLGLGREELEEERPYTPHYPLLAGLGLTLAVGSNAVYAVLVPVWGLWLLRRWPQREKWPAMLATFAAPLLLLAAGLLLYNWQRFGHLLETGYHFAPDQEGFTTPLWWGVLGLTLSPARGLIWYAPPILLGLWGLPQSYRRRPLLTQLILLVVLFHLLAFGTWWEWWGGYAWGPRFLLPLIPLLLLAGVPLLACALTGERLVQAALGLVAVAGLVVQLGGTAVDFNRYEIYLDEHFPAPTGQLLRYHHDPQLVWSIAGSPIVAHWQLWLDGSRQYPWWHPDAYPPPGLDEIPHQISAEQQPGDLIVNLVPELLYDLLDQPELPPTYGLPYLVDPADPQARQLFAQVKTDAGRVWLITWFQPGEAANWYEQELRREWASVRDVWADDLRLLLLAKPPPAASPQPGAARFGPIHLRDYAVQLSDSHLFVTLTWAAEETLAEDYVSFVHILDEIGQVIAQQDRPPLAGYRPNTGWQPGEPVTDRFAFPRHTLPESGWQVAVGWYSWPSLERLPLTVQGEIIPSGQYPLP